MKGTPTLSEIPFLQDVGENSQSPADPLIMAIKDDLFRDSKAADSS